MPAGWILEKECKSSVESVSDFVYLCKCVCVWLLTFPQPSLTGTDHRQGPHSCPVVIKQKKRDNDMLQ